MERLGGQRGVETERLGGKNTQCVCLCVCVHTTNLYCWVLAFVYSEVHLLAASVLLQSSQAAVAWPSVPLTACGLFTYTSSQVG